MQSAVLRDVFIKKTAFHHLLIQYSMIPAACQDGLLCLCQFISKCGNLLPVLLIQGRFDRNDSFGKCEIL